MIDAWQLDTRRLGRRVLVYPQTDSTNSRALEHVGLSDSDGLAFLADEQLAGRGQHGRRWVAPAKSSVLLSLLLYPPVAIQRPVLLTAWAAVSVCELVHRQTGAAPRIKWPNDVLVADRKICGILIEQSRQGGVTATVAGIGLNVTQTEADLTAAGLPEATSLAAQGATESDSHVIARDLIGLLDEWYESLLQGDHDALEAQWVKRLGLLGRPVVVEAVDQCHQGRLLECAFDHILLIEGEQMINIQPELIRHIHPC